MTQPDLPQIAAIRLEALPDGALPNRGPGRHRSGNFQLRALRVFTSRKSGGEPADRVRIAKAAASCEHTAANVNVAGTIDETLGTMWHVEGRYGPRHQAFYGLDNPIVTAATQPFIIQLDQHDTLTLGRFRLSVSSEHLLEVDSRLVRRAESDEYQRAVGKLLIEPELARLSQAIADNHSPAVVGPQDDPVSA